MVLRPIRALAVVAAGLLCMGLSAPAAAQAEESEVPPAVGRVAAVFALTAPAASTSLISSEDLALYTSPTGVLSRELSEVIDTPVAIGIDPMILASIRVLGSAAPPSAVAWIERLAAATNETFPLAYADADLTLTLQAGAPGVLAPTSFDFAVDPGRFAAPSTETPGPTPTEESTPASTVTAEPEDGDPEPTGPPQLPTTESLLAWDYTLADVAWPVAGSVVSSDLAAITAAGYGTTILSSGNVQRASASQSSVTVGGASAVVTDDGVSALFDAAITAPTNEEWQPSMAALQASVDSAAALGGAEGATVVVAANRGTLAETTRLVATLSTIDALPSVDLAPLSTIASAPPADAQLVESPQTPERVAVAASLLASEAADGAFSTVAENPLLITGDRRLRLLTVLSSAWVALPGGFTTVSGAYLTESTDLQQSVRVVKSSAITLLADRASLPVTVNNSLGQPVTVNVSVSARSAVLAVEEPTVAITIEPDSQKRASIPVQSLSNGTALINVSISSPVGVPVGTTSTVRINVYAGWETPITVAIGVVVFLVFGLGIARTIVRRRRSRPGSAE
jgi:hypothetical protein